MVGFGLRDRGGGSEQPCLSASPPALSLEPCLSCIPRKPALALLGHKGPIGGSEPEFLAPRPSATLHHLALYLDSTDIHDTGSCLHWALTVTSSLPVHTRAREGPLGPFPGQGPEVQRR